MEKRKPAEAGVATRTRTGVARLGPSLTREAQVRIGHQLRSLYDDVVREGVPERFIALLNRFEQSERDNDRG
jgi:hypothetical protein